jgi:hypothetical protein
MASGNQFSEWFNSQYTSELFQKRPKWPPAFMKFLDSIDPHKMSGNRRMNSFVVNKYNYPLKKTGYAMSVCKCEFKNGTKEYETYYSYIYWPLGNKKVDPEYICLSPTFTSKDGEYRGDGFIIWEAFEEGYEMFANMLSEIEEIIIDMINDQTIETKLLVFPIEHSDIILNRADELRVLIRSLAVCLLLDGRAYKNGLLPSHTNTSYLDLLRIFYENKTAKDLIMKVDIKMVSELTIFKTGMKGAPSRPKCGQKIVPLSLKDVNYPMDPRYKIWKEINANLLCTNLVLNFISPCFPIYNNWTYIRGIDEHFFENDLMKQKYLMSTKAELVTESLKEAKKKIPVSPDGMPINYSFGQFNIKIYEAIEYGEKSLLMSDVSAISLAEYTGVVFGSLTKFIRGRERTPPSFDQIFSNVNHFARYMFDLYYGCYTMHSKLGLIHADLHLNNVTLLESAAGYKIVETLDGKSEFKPVYKNPKIAYIIGPDGEYDTFVLPHYGQYMCIIDFSRCIIGGQYLEQLRKERGEIYAMDLFESQENTILTLIKNHAQRLYEKHKKDIEPMVRSDPKTIFKLLSAVDFIHFGRLTVTYLEQEIKRMKTPLAPLERRHCEISTECIKLANKMWDVSLEVLQKNMIEVFEKKNTNIQFAGYEIIHKVFDNYLYNNLAPEDKKEITLVDMYNYNNDIKYMCQDYNQWPKWAKWETIQENLFGLKITDILNRGIEPIKNALEHNIEYEKLLEKEREKLVSSPDLMASSVLPD